MCFLSLTFHTILYNYVKTGENSSHLLLNLIALVIIVYASWYKEMICKPVMLRVLFSRVLVNRVMVSRVSRIRVRARLVINISRPVSFPACTKIHSGYHQRM